MMKDKEKLPYRITEYIQEHFREDFLFDVRDVQLVNGKLFYTIEVSKDNYIHTLKFDESGNIVKEETDEAFGPDIHDEPGFGEVPE